MSYFFTQPNLKILLLKLGAKSWLVWLGWLERHAVHRKVTGSNPS